MKPRTSRTAPALAALAASALALAACGTDGDGRSHILGHVKVLSADGWLGLADEDITFTALSCGKSVDWTEPTTSTTAATTSDTTSATSTAKSSPTSSS